VKGRDKDRTHGNAGKTHFSNSLMIFGKNKGNLIK
jgi:hypothetical protein